VAAAHADDRRLFLSPALDYPQDGLDVLVVLDGVIKFPQRVVQALVGPSFFDAAKQLGVSNLLSIGVGLHSSKKTRSAAQSGLGIESAGGSRAWLLGWRIGFW
jgi:hypothetical protein